MAGPKDQGRWTAVRWEQERGAAALTASGTEREKGPDAAREVLSDAIAALESDLQADAQLRRFALVTQLLALHARQGVMTAPEAARLADTGEAILRAQGVAPLASRLSFLHGELALVTARVRRREGRSWQAAWTTQLGLFLAKGVGEGGEGVQALATADEALRRGDAALALEGFSIAGRDPELSRRARLGKLTALRLSGRLGEASALADAAGPGGSGSAVAARAGGPAPADAARPDASRPSAGEEDRQFDVYFEGFAWEALRREAQATADLTRMVAAVNRAGGHRDAARVLEAGLWTKAVPVKSWLGRVPKPETVRRTFGDDFRRGSPLAALYECALAIDRAHDQEIPLQLRLRDLGDALEQAPRVPSIDAELLVWAAAARWLVRHHQPLLAAQAASEYRALSLRLSDGAVPDALLLLRDLSVNAWFRFGEEARAAARHEQEALERVQTGRIARASEVTRFTLGLAGAMLKGKVKRLGRSPEAKERLYTEELSQIAASITKTLGGLKGPYVKFGQILSFLSPRLPKEIQEAVDAMREGAPPMAAAVIRRVVEDELGAPPEKLFAEWSDEPLAAASIAQIHRAVLFDGRPVVVKVQYPGIKEAIGADHKLIAMLAPIFRFIFPAANVDDVIAVSTAQLLDECEFLREASLQKEARLLAAKFPDVFVPAVIDEFTSRRVITMEYVEGERFSTFAETASQERRDAAGRTIYRFGWETLFHSGFFNGDPHPGNFLFLPDGRVAFLDFGYGDHCNALRLEQWKGLFRSLLEEDRPRFDAAVSGMGFTAPGYELDLEAAWRVGLANTAMLRMAGAGKFDRQALMRNVEGATIGTPNRMVVRLPLEDMKFLRYSWCMQGTLSALGASVHWAEIMKPLLYEPGPGSPTAAGRGAS